MTYGILRGNVLRYFLHLESVLSLAGISPQNLFSYISQSFPFLSSPELYPMKSTIANQTPRFACHLIVTFP